MTSVNQSQSEIEVAGLRSTMQTDLNIANRDMKITYGLDYDWEKISNLLTFWRLNILI